jgi:hypothetical protein
LAWANWLVRRAWLVLKYSQLFHCSRIGLNKVSSLTGVILCRTRRRRRYISEVPDCVIPSASELDSLQKYFEPPAFPAYRCGSHLRARGFENDMYRKDALNLRNLRKKIPSFMKTSHVPESAAKM